MNHVRERNIERYFKRRVREVGGEVRKLKWGGRAHAPDRFTGFPRLGRHYMVELKRPTKTPRKGQSREHARLRAMGVEVRVLSTYLEVDCFIEEATTSGGWGVVR